MAREKLPSVDAIRALPELLESIFEHVPFALGVREVRGEDILHVADNPELAQLFDKLPDELVGKSELELGVEPAVVERALERMREARLSQHPVPFDLTFRDGRSYAGSVIALPPDAPDADLYLVAAQNVTEMRRLQAELMRQERLASVGALVATVAHEVLNPATYALLRTRHARQLLDADAAAVLDDDLKAIEEGLVHICDVAKQIRTVSSPRSPNLEPLRMGEIVESALALAGAMYGGLAEVRFQCERDPRVLAEPVALRQIVVNLVHNAAEAVTRSPTGGSVLVRTDWDDGSGLLEVCDDGDGFPEELLDQPFEPFRAGQPGGLGLGLHVSFRLAERMGGSIAAENRPEGGARVCVRLPRA